MKTTKAVGMGLLLILSLATLVMLSFGANIFLPASGATDDTAQGSFTINAAPSVSGVDFQDDSYTPVSSLTPDATTYFRLNFTIALASGIDDILNATIYIYDDSTYGATYNTSSPDGLQLTTFSWTESTDTWALEDQGALTGWSIDNTNSDDPGAASALTTFDFSMRMQISRVARYDVTDWNATVHVYDDDVTPEVDYSAESALVTMAEYLNVSYSAATFSWGNNIEPNSINNTHGALSISVIANRIWELRINATDFNATAQSDVDIEAQNIMIWDQDGSGGGISQYIRNTIATLPTGSTWDAQAANTVETAQTRNCYFLLNPAAYFVAGSVYSSWVTIWIQANV